MTRREAGFTLMEMMVTLVVISVMTGATILGLGAAGRDAQAESEARRFANSLTQAADEAMIEGRRLALRWDDETYEIMSWSAEQRDWTPFAMETLEKPRELPAGLRLESGAAPLIEITPDGAGPSASFMLSGRSGVWRVKFNGFDAEVESAGAA